MWRHCNHRQRRTSTEAQPYTAAAAIFHPVTHAYSTTHANPGAHANTHSADLDPKHQFSPRATGPGAATATLIRIPNDHLRSRRRSNGQLPG